MAQGDYHNLALTSSGESNLGLRISCSQPSLIPFFCTLAGQLLAWGAYSSGALGLGHPQLLNTPLSAPSPSPRSPTAAPTATQPTRNELRFPGFAPNREIVYPEAPSKVDSPMLVRFPGEEASTMIEGEREKGKFVFAITASGWHSGALAVEIAEDGEGEAGVKEEEGPRIRLKQQPAQEERRGNEEGESNDDGPTTGFAGMMRRGFRVGFAGRGLGRGMRGVGR